MYLLYLCCLLDFLNLIIFQYIYVNLFIELVSCIFNLLFGIILLFCYLFGFNFHGCGLIMIFIFFGFFLIILLNVNVIYKFYHSLFLTLCISFNFILHLIMLIAPQLLLFINFFHIISFLFKLLLKLIQIFLISLLKQSVIF